MQVFVSVQVDGKMYGMGALGSMVLPETPAKDVTTWTAGSTPRVAWGMRYNHGGGYQYRLCPAEKMPCTVLLFCFFALCYGPRSFYFVSQSRLATLQPSLMCIPSIRSVRTRNTSCEARPHLPCASDDGLHTGSEQDFQQLPLDFVRSSHAIMWNNGTLYPIKGKFVDGSVCAVVPKGSTWARNPIPRIHTDNVGMACATHPPFPPCR